MVIVKVKEGLLEGEERELVTGDGKYYSFKGVPYAAPPLGKLRFKAPEPLEPWTGVRKAFEHGPICHQYDLFTGTIPPGNEDCLYLNIYSPDVKPSGDSAGAPVMVWIHGGNFKAGSGNSDLYGPDFLLRQGVVLVTINYRLEVLGFLCLDTVDVPGNAGLKDQAAALRWVKDNIASFGGDPDNVTIFGESAGGASVGFHLLSPLSKGLFHRAILMSGVPLCDWATTFEPRRRALLLARQLGASDETIADPQSLLEFFQSIHVEKLINCNISILLWESRGQGASFSPVVEKDFGDNRQFILQNPADYLKRGNIRDVEIMIGYNSEESIIASGFLKSQEAQLDQYIESLLPGGLLLKLTVEQGFNAAKMIREHYFGDKKISLDSLGELVKLFSWTIFKYNILRFLRDYAKSAKSRKYLYQFSCESERNVNALNISVGVGQTLKGVSHLDDLPYVFDQPAMKLPLDKSGKSFQMIEQTTALLTNFAKHGNPSPDASGPKWLPYTAENENYLDIGEQLTSGTSLEKEEFEFWDSLYSLAIQ